MNNNWSENVYQHNMYDLNNRNIKALLEFYSIMMLMKFTDFSQSDRSNWVLGHIKAPRPGPSFNKKYKKLDNVAVHLITF